MTSIEEVSMDRIWENGHNWWPFLTCGLQRVGVSSESNIGQNMAYGNWNTEKLDLPPSKWPNMFGISSSSSSSFAVCFPLRPIYPFSMIFYTIEEGLLRSRSSNGTIVLMMMQMMTCVFIMSLLGKRILAFGTWHGFMNYVNTVSQGFYVTLISKLRSECNR